MTVDHSHLRDLISLSINATHKTPTVLERGVMNIKLGFSIPVDALTLAPGERTYAHS